MAEVETAYYLRMRVDDRPGVLADVTRILADLSISIDAMVQKVGLVKPPPEKTAEKTEAKAEEKEKAPAVALEASKDEKPKVSEPPPNDMDWADAPSGHKTAPPGGMSEVENEPTVSQRGDQIPDSSIGEDAMMIVVDEDEGEPVTATGERHDPPTAPKIKAAGASDDAEDTDIRDGRGRTPLDLLREQSKKFPAVPGYAEAERLLLAAEARQADKK